MTPWHFTTWLDFFDHWQSLAAGMVAVFAAVVAVGGTEFFAHRKKRHEIEAMRVALAVEARWLMETMISAHGAVVDMLEMYKEAAVRGIGAIPPAEMERSRTVVNRIRSVRRFLGELPKPVIYPACADRIGLLSRRLAEGVAGFYGNIKHLQFLASIIIPGIPDEAEATTSAAIEQYALGLEQACQGGLSLFEELPPNGVRDPADLRDLKAKVEGMAKRHMLARPEKNSRLGV